MGTGGIYTVLRGALQDAIVLHRHARRYFYTQAHKQQKHLAIQRTLNERDSEVLFTMPLLDALGNAKARDFPSSKDLHTAPDC